MEAVDQEVEISPVRSSAYYSPNTLICDENQSRLLRDRDTLTSTYFEIGDIANEEILRNSHRKGITDQMVYDAVGVFAGKSGRTVRYYAENAAFFSPETRQEYDMLSFAHFDTARNYPDIWIEVLQVCSTNPGMTAEELARYAGTLREIISDVRSGACEKNSDVHSDAYENAVSLALLTGDYEKLVGEIKKETPLKGGVFSSAQLVGKILNALASLSRLLSDYDISDELKVEVSDHVDALNRLIPRVVKDIDRKRSEKK